MSQYDYLKVLGSGGDDDGHMVLFVGARPRPQPATRAMVAADWFGEENRALQLLCYDTEDEVAVAVRYAADGSIAEVMLRDDLIDKVVRDDVTTDWMRKRDGAEDDDLDEPLPERTCSIDGESCESCT
jgi:hypothetical protein